MIGRTPPHRTAAALLLAALALSASACQSDATSPEGDAPSLDGKVCPSCSPNAGGETGDFGGTPTPCEGVSRPVAIDLAAATALGFDVAELERRIARPIDMPLQWRPTQTAGGVPATGYETDTRIRARLTSTSDLHHVRPDPAFCDGTTCMIADLEMRQDSCPDRLELGVQADVETLDGALHATTNGIAVQQRRGASEPLPQSLREPFAVLRANLTEVTGRLRLAPEPNAFRYRGVLIFEVRLLPDSSEGELSPNVMVEDSAWTGTLYHPLSGSFPPRVDAGGTDPGDAGARREP